MMKNFLTCLFFILFLLGGCSGGSSGGAANTLLGGNTNGTAKIPASQIEIEKLQAAIKADDVYKIDDSEISLLKDEGILEESELIQIQAIQ